MNSLLGKMKQTRPIIILPIEDNPAHVRLTKEAFNEAGMDINLQVAVKGSVAIQLLHKQSPYENNTPPYQILLNGNLPKLDRKEVSKVIKSDSKLTRITTVVWTTSNAESDIVTCYNLLINRHLNKHVDFDSYYETTKTIEACWLSTAVPPSIAV